MEQKLNAIMLVDDDEATNFINETVINLAGCSENLYVAENGQEALDLLIKKVDGEYRDPPELIFLDINMPRLDGWEFLEKYRNMDEIQKAKIIIVMLTTSLNPDDQVKADSIEEITGFMSKPLTVDKLKDLLQQFFPLRYR